MNSQTKKQIGFAVFTFVIYTLLINWQVALLLMIGVGFHEYSHLWAAQRMNLKTKGFYLVPFMGGVALVEGKFKTYGEQAFVVLAGPVGGGLLALVTAGAYYLTGMPFLAAAAVWMCLLNCFNLLPLSFMDGGQLLSTITYSINRTFGVFATALSTAIAIFVLWKLNPVLSVLIGVFGGMSSVTDILNWYHYRNGREYLCSDSFLYPPAKLTKLQMVLTLVGWVATAAILLVAMYFLKQHPEANLATLIKKN